MTLLIAYGNPGRGDDGLGIAFANWAAGEQFEGLEILAGFQLTVEHALAVSKADQVVFVDAAIDLEEGCRISALEPSSDYAVDSHNLHPATVLKLADLLFGTAPPSHLLMIGGTSFDVLHDSLSPHAERNLDLAKKRFSDWIVQDAARSGRITPSAMDLDVAVSGLPE